MTQDIEAEFLLGLAKEQGYLSGRQIKTFATVERKLAKLGITKTLLEIALDHGAITEKQLLELSGAPDPEPDTPEGAATADPAARSRREQTMTMLGKTRRVSPDSMTMAFTGEIRIEEDPDADPTLDGGSSHGPLTLVGFHDDMLGLRPEEFVGKTLGGCELREFLSHGAMGLVFKAHHTTLNKVVAVKVLSPALFNDEEQVAQFFREAQAAASTEHENIVGVYDLGLEDDLYYIVMQFIEGGSVEDLLSRGETLTFQQAARIALETAQGLAGAHARGIVHRDIKPANLMLTDTGRIRIADFGLAFEQKSSEVGEIRKVMGTPSYMAPEQIAGRTVDQRADLYSLGVTLYYLVTGRKPFTGVNAQEVVRKHLLERPVLPRSIDPKIPEELEHIIERLMAKEPDNRYSNARELIVDIEEYLHGGEPRAVHAMEDFLSKMENISRGSGAATRPGMGLSRFVLGGLAGATLMFLFSLGLPSIPVRVSNGPPALSEAMQAAERRFAAAEQFARRFPGDLPEIRRRLEAIAQSTPYPYPKNARELLSKLLRSRKAKIKDEVEEIYSRATQALPDPVAALGVLEEVPPEKLEEPLAEQIENLRRRCRSEIRKETGEVYVPGGTFLFGPERQPTTLPAYLIDRSEVTNAEYAKFLSATGRPPPDQWPGGKIPAGEERHPVVGVSFDDASAFAEWAGKRLPTSREWEKAARGTDGRDYPWGSDYDPRRAIARGALGPGPADSHPEGTSPWGCVNMAGNAFEWTSTPAEGESGGDEERIVRGGCWRSHPANVRTFAVWNLPEGDRDPTHAVGFRCVRDLGR